jgi:hypothetical protein
MTLFDPLCLSLLNFMIAYVFLLFAFASSSMIVFPNNEAFALLPSAFIKVSLPHFGQDTF